jgi:hypothetical protein
LKKLKEKFKKIAIFSAILAVIFTNGYFGLLEAKKSVFEQKIATKSKQQYYIVVKDVDTAMAKESAVVVSLRQNLNNSSNCRMVSSVQDRNYFQDQAILDLNQPSGCFSLSLGRIQTVASNLEVRSLSQRQGRVVVIELPSNFYSASYKNHSFPEEKNSIFFLNSFSFAPKSVWLCFGSVALKQTSETVDVPMQRTVEELQNLRC